MKERKKSISFVRGIIKHNQRPEITFIDKKVYDRIPDQIYALLKGIKNE